jgi:drug/metabolite transporter (DMT)-like permease
VRNTALNVLVALSGLATAVTGIYLLFAPSGHGSSQAVAWDLVHTWAGVVMIVAAAAHLAIHWRWVKNVTLRLLPAKPRASQPAEAPVRG